MGLGVTDLWAYRYTCGRRFGSLGYEEIDAQTYAEWEIDYLSKSLRKPSLRPAHPSIHPTEYDNCYNEGRHGTPLVSYERYANMSRALNSTGRPILYSMCNWGEDGTWNWATEIANSWRMSGDIKDVSRISSEPSLNGSNRRADL